MSGVICGVIDDQYYKGSKERQRVEVCHRQTTTQYEDRSIGDSEVL